MSHFEIIQTNADQPWHARFVASNGRKVWVTENYASRKRVLRAIELIVDEFSGVWIDPRWTAEKGKSVAAVVYRSNHWEKADSCRIEIRDVDERTATTRSTS